VASWAEQVSPDGDGASVELVRLLAHDVNNPLTAIRIISEMLRDELDDAEQRRDMVDIMEAADLAGALIESMVSMVEGLETDTFTWFPLDLLGLVQQVIDRPALRRYVRIDSEGEVPMTGDRAALRRALTDVLVNGRRLVGPKEVLTVTVAESGHDILVDVFHPGEGIPRAMRPLLFEPHGSVILRKNRIPVSASGLAYARAVVEGHGGSIDLSEAGEEGANLRIRLKK